MTNAELVGRKLRTLAEFAQRARARRPSSASELEGDTTLQDAISMAPLVAIQECIDIAFHVVTDEL